MTLKKLSIEGSYELLGASHVDERGFFARTLEYAELAAHGLRDRFEQESVSFNAVRGTLRGLHYQAEPGWETKIVTCVAGRVFDVVVDLRKESKTFGTWDAIELSAQRCNSVYVPIGCAHGFQTLEGASVVLYRISPAYRAQLQRGINPFDVTLRIRWPVQDAITSERDRSLPALSDLP